jgi:ketosteroid isomerase-like protein
VREGILAFYERFSSGDASRFAGGIADVPGVSVIGSAPGEGHDGRAGWIEAYATQIGELGVTFRGHDPTGFEEGSLGFGTDTPAFVLPDGSTLPTRLTAVLRRESAGGEWKVVHLHFSVGVPDEEAIKPPG